jgi:tetratricopeptide (TPR) repeat protein
VKVRRLEALRQGQEPDPTPSARVVVPFAQRRDLEEADRWFALGCRLDENVSTRREAEDAYRRALAVNPLHANALTNLGNLRHKAGERRDAYRLYRKAIEAEPRQPEAHYNTGFLLHEEGRHRDALRWLEKAIELDPNFADAHFNVALVLRDLGRVEDARTHWGHYLEIQPDGEWSELARRHLDETDPEGKVPKRTQPDWFVDLIRKAIRKGRSTLRIRDPRTNEVVGVVDLHDLFDGEP